MDFAIFRDELDILAQSHGFDSKKTGKNRLVLVLKKQMENAYIHMEITKQKLVVSFTIKHSSEDTQVKSFIPNTDDDFYINRLKLYIKIHEQIISNLNVLDTIEFSNDKLKDIFHVHSHEDIEFVVSRYKNKHSICNTDLLKIRTNIERLIESDITAHTVAKETGIARNTAYRILDGEASIDNITLKNAEILAEYWEQKKTD